jgi:hypothetical protein
MTVPVTFKKEYKADIKTSFNDVEILQGPLWDKLPGVDVIVKDSSGTKKESASYSVNRDLLDGKTYTSSITTHRGVVQNYTTYASSSSFYTLGNTEQITKIKTM